MSVGRLGRVRASTLGIGQGVVGEVPEYQVKKKRIEKYQSVRWPPLIQAWKNKRITTTTFTFLCFLCWNVVVFCLVFVVIFIFIGFRVFDARRHCTTECPPSVSPTIVHWNFGYRWLINASPVVNRLQVVNFLTFNLKVKNDKITCCACNIDWLTVSQQEASSN